MITMKSKIEFTITLTLSKEEAEALQSFASFSSEDIIRVFDERLGSQLRTKHEAGFVSFLNQVKHDLGPILQTVREVENRLVTK